MSYQERDMLSELGRWVLHSWDLGSAPVEGKICKKKSLPFSRIEPGQIQFLLDAKHGIAKHKISDMGLGNKGVDMVIFQSSPAFLAIMFYKPRHPKIVYLIDIDAWLAFQKSTTKKSITESECSQIATRIIDLNAPNEKDKLISDGDI